MTSSKASQSASQDILESGVIVYFISENLHLYSTFNVWRMLQGYGLASELVKGPDGGWGGES